MDYPQFLSSLIFFIAPPLVLLVVRKLNKNPPSATPIWQYAIIFFTMSVLTMTGEAEYKLMTLGIGAVIYLYCYYLESRPAIKKV
jgi:drug/metabolite transporter (DMT)-like permease